MNKFIRPLFMQEFAILIPFFLLLTFFYTRNEAMLNEITIFSILRTIGRNWNGFHDQGWKLFVHKWITNLSPS